MAKIHRALISVSDKTGVLEFAKGLAELGVEIISTGGTAKLFQDNGLKVQPVSQVTHFPEMLDGRVKTLHPAIHGGILARRDNAEHLAQIQRQGILPLDMVVVNLYPFERTVADPGVNFEHAVENIDIGGPTMLRSAAKNFNDVAALVDPADYKTVLDEMKANDCKLSQATKFRLACKVFEHTSRYDSAIIQYLEEINPKDGLFVRTPEVFPGHLRLEMEKLQGLRYGENPHQKAAFYKDIKQPAGLAQARQLQGKELSFNNILDLEAAYRIAADFSEPAAVIIKHTNPCGVATADSIAQAYVLARETDPVSAFGGILGFNRTVDSGTAIEIVSTFVEAVIAPGYDRQALDVLSSKANVRLLELPNFGAGVNQGWDVKRVSGGFLIQELDTGSVNLRECKVVTKRQPTENEYKAMALGWKVAKHVKSNAIVFSDSSRILGIGAGQMSRVDSTKVAIMKARSPLKGSTLASDAFFPFRDGVDTAAEAGATAIIQPGGSLKDNEVIQAADEHNITMVFTGIRHFKH